MKTLRTIGMALMTILACVNFASCNNEDNLIAEDSDKYITVGLNCVGEYLDISHSPLSRAERGDAYYIQVFSLEEKTYDYGDGDIYTDIVEKQYAFGDFTSLDNAVIKLLDGFKYRIEVAIRIGKAEQDYDDYYNRFHYGITGCSHAYLVIRQEDEAFYGEIDQYIPEVGKSVNIDTKRVSFGAEFIALGLEEGVLEVNELSGYALDVNLTPENPQHNGIFSFDAWDIWDAWRGKAVVVGYDEEDEPIYEYENYTKEHTIRFNWIKDDGSVIPLGEYDITFERNKKTTIRIKVEEVGISNGVILSRESTPIEDAENDYLIEGGKIIEVPVGNGQN